MMDRRMMFFSAAGLGGFFAFRWLRGADAQAAGPQPKFEIEMTEAGIGVVNPNRSRT